MKKSELVNMITEIMGNEVAKDRCNICKRNGTQNCPDYCEIESAFDLDDGKLKAVSEKIVNEIANR